MQRRSLLATLLLAPLALTARRGTAATALTREAVEAMRRDWRGLLAPGADVATSPAKLERTEAEWRRLLTPAQFQILREEGTERPGSSPLNAEKRPGVYACAACALPLFTSAMKYESGTGWPSFFTTIPGVFGTKTDIKLFVPRTEYHCARCGGHHGHVFPDGPPPTGERWCNNGYALRFIPKA